MRLPIIEINVNNISKSVTIFGCEENRAKGYMPEHTESQKESKVKEVYGALSKLSCFQSVSSYTGSNDWDTDWHGDEIVVPQFSKKKGQRGKPEKRLSYFEEMPKSWEEGVFIKLEMKQQMLRPLQAAFGALGFNMSDNEIKKLVKEIKSKDHFSKYLKGDPYEED